MSTRNDWRAAESADGTALYTEAVARAAAAPALSLQQLARIQGLGTEALSRLVSTHAQMPPARWLERVRIDQAARQLLAGRKAPASIAADTGFAGADAFARAFLEHAHMSPEAYRRLRKSNEFELALPRRYRSAEILAYHGRDAEGVCERVTGQRLLKALSLEGGAAVLEIVLGARCASCRLHTASVPSSIGMQAAHRVAVRMLGLGLDVAAFERRAHRDGRLAQLVGRRRGLRIALAASVYDALCWAITGQQINVAFASQLRRALIRLAGQRVGDMRAHPLPSDIAALDVSDLRRLRFSRAKAEYLIDTARAVVVGRIAPEELEQGSAQAAEQRLVQLRGVGTWTARYVLMRGAGFADCAPVGDAALAAAAQKLTGGAQRPSSEAVEALLVPLAPHRSLAAAHLWASLLDSA